MSKSLRAQLAALGDEVRAATPPGACTLTATWCVGQLPALYDKFTQTNESRYCEEITRLVQLMLKGMMQSTEVSPGAQKLEAKLIDRLRLLHERFGLSPLNLRPFRASPHRPERLVKREKKQRTS